MQLINSHNLYHRLDIEGQSYTAMDTGIHASGPGINRIRRTIGGSAILASRQNGELEMRRIPVRQIMELEGNIHIVLDEYFMGHTLMDYLGYRDDFSSSKAAFFSILFGLVSDHPSIVPTVINPHHILHCGDESVLILPESWSEVLNSYESDESLNEGVYRINYPDTDMYDSGRITVFGLANALQYVITQRWLHPGDSVEDQRRYQRKKIFAPMEVICPELDPDFSRWINQALMLEGDGIGANLDQWLESIAQNPPHISDTALPDLRAPADPEAKKRENPSLTRYRKRVRRELAFDWFRRHRLLVGGVSLAAVIVIAGLVTMVQNLTRDIAVTGLTPSEVVTGFYESYNSLNHEFMSDAVSSGAGRSEINRITNIFVVSQIREGTELRSVFMPAGEWLDIPEEDRPVIPDVMVFGVTELSVGGGRQITGADGEFLYEFEADYLIWDVDTDRNELFSTPRSDILRLEEFRRGWKIVEIIARNR